MLVTQLRSWKKARMRVSPRTAPGAPPGTLVVDPAAARPVIRVLAYDSDDLAEETVTDPGALSGYLEKWPITWVNVDGLGDADVMKAIGEAFGLHPLALEDAVNANQRPKLEEYGDQVFIVVRMPHLEADTVHSEQLSIFLGPNFVLTCQERPGDCFDPVRRRIHETRRERFTRPDYLMYALLDAVVDSYFPVLEALGERLDQLEEEIADGPDNAVIRRVHAAKHTMLALRRSIWPARDVLNSLVRDPIPQISDDTRTYLRDCYDHAVRVIDLVETYRELTTGLTELYQSTVGYRLNEVMKVLTVIATIFIPLTFVAGIYGMNFNTAVSSWNLPELNWPLGYPFALSLMAFIFAGMILYFRRRGWIG